MKKQLFITVCLLLLAGQWSLASTVAHWRFEQGPDNTAVIHTGTNGVYYPDIMDMSGNGNHLSVWQTGGGGGYNYRSQVPVSVVPQTGAANNFSVKNSGGGPAMWCAAPAMQTMTPAQFTIEAYFKPEANAGHRTFVGRDSQGATLSNAALSALYFKVNPNDSVAIGFGDMAGNWHNAESVGGLIQGFTFSSNPEGLNPVTPWYYMAAVSDGQTLSLYLANVTAGTGLDLVAQVDISSSPDTRMTAGAGSGGDWQAGNWSVGRGLWNGGHVDRAYGFIDEVRISDAALHPSFFLYNHSVAAWNPTPEQGATNYGFTPDGVTVSAELSWKTGLDPNDPGQVNPAILTHDLFMSDDQNEENADPSLKFVASIPAVGESAEITIENLNFGGLYRWRVDQGIDDGSGVAYPQGDPNNIIGAVWTFGSRFASPIITAQPVDQIINAGVTAEFSVGVDSVSPAGYAWYKSMDNANNTPDDDLWITNSPTLTLTNAQVADEGFYYCVVTNDSMVSVVSNTAALEILRLRAWYAFENDLTDSASDFDGSPNIDDPELTFSYAAGIDGNAIVLENDGQSVTIPRSIQDSFTIKLWVKTTDTGGTGGWWNGKGLVDGEMPGGVNDFGTALIGSKFGFGVGNPNVTIVSDTDINDGEWHFCVATRDHLTGEMLLFVDGLQERSATGGTGRKAAPPALRIGAIQTNANFLDGMIDEVKLYNYVVDPIDIAVEYTGIADVSVCFDRPALDYNNDCVVNIEDFAVFAGHWLDCAIVPNCLP